MSFQLDDIYRKINEKNLQYLTMIGFSGGDDCIRVEFIKDDPEETDMYFEVVFEIYEDYKDYTVSTKEYLFDKTLDECSKEVFEWAIELKEMFGL